MLKSILILLLVYSNIAAEVNLKLTAADRQIIYHTYNFEFDKAESILQAELKKDPNNLKFYFLSLGIKSMMIERKVFDEIPARKWEVKERLLLEGIDYANSILEKFENVKLTTENKFYLGCVYGYLGRMYGVTKSWMSAFSDGKTGRNMLEEVIEENPEFNDAYLLLGMFNYYGDRMGGFLGFVAGILGFSGDRDLGIEYILRAYNNGFLLPDQAELLLIELYSTLEANKLAAIALHRKFVSKYPNNHHILNWYFRDLLYLDMTDEASVIAKEKNEFIDPLLMADYYYKIGDFKKSEFYLKKSEAKIENYYEGQKKQIKVLGVLNSWMQSKKLNITNIPEDYQELYKEFKSDEVFSKKVFELSIAMREDSFTKEQKELLTSSPRINNKMPDIKLAFDSGVYYFQKKNYEEARKRFERVKFFDKKHYHFRAIQYLIPIYDELIVSKGKVTSLIEEIEEMDYEKLSYSVRNLAKKYNIDQ